MDGEAQFGEADPDSVDREWGEFAKLVEKKRKRQEQSFYPFPPQEEDYVNTLVRPPFQNSPTLYRRLLKFLEKKTVLFPDVRPLQPTAGRVCEIGKPETGRKTTAQRRKSQKKRTERLPRQTSQNRIVPMEAHVRSFGRRLGVSGTSGCYNGCIEFHHG